MQALGVDPMLLAAGATLALLVLVIMSMRRVPQGYEYTLERFGRFRRVLAPGLRFVVPVADRVGARQDMRERHLKLAESEMLTRDQVPVTVDATAFYQIQDAARASYEVDDLDASLHALLLVSLRTLIGSRDLEALLDARAELNAALLEAADAAAGVWGVRLTRTEIGALTPPQAMVEAVAQAREAALRQRSEDALAASRARTRRLEAEAVAATRRAEAEAGADAARLEAEAGERAAEGDARAALMLSRAVHEGDPRALNYMLARRYVDALKTLAASDNGRFVVLPLENGGIAASLTGIRELAEETFAHLDGEGSGSGSGSGSGATVSSASRPASAETSGEAVADKPAPARRTAAPAAGPRITPAKEAGGR